MMRNKIVKVLIAGGATVLAINAYAFLPVIDPTAIGQLLKEVSIMTQEVSLAQQSYETMKQELATAKGAYGWGNVLDSGQQFINDWQWSAKTWQNALQGSCGGNAARCQQLQQQYKQNNYYMSPQQYQQANPSPNQGQAYNNEVATNQTSGVMGQQEYEDVNQHVSEIQSLLQMVETAQNSDIKSATDLNSRISAENALVGSEALRMESAMNNQMASEQAYQITGQTEAANFDSGDQQY